MDIEQPAEVSAYAEAGAAGDGVAATDGRTAQSRLQFERENGEGTVTYRLVGSLDIHTIERWMTEIGGIREEDLRAGVTLDMSQVTHLDQSGVTSLLKLRTRQLQAGNKESLRVINPSEPVRSLLGPSRLTKPGKQKPRTIVLESSEPPPEDTARSPEAVALVEQLSAEQDRTAKRRIFLEALVAADAATRDDLLRAALDISQSREETMERTIAAATLETDRIRKFQVGLIAEERQPEHVAEEMGEKKVSFSSNPLKVKRFKEKLKKAYPGAYQEARAAREIYKLR